MNRLIRILKIALRWFVYVLGFTVVTAVLLFLFVGYTAPGARLVAAAIERYASTPDQIVRISDPGPLLTGNFTASTIGLFDSKGLYAEIRDVDIKWTPAALVSTRFDAASLTAGSVRLDRLPSPSQETQEVRSTFALPLDVKIDVIDLKEVVIGKEIAGSDQMLALKGKVDATNSSIAAALDVAQRDRPDARAVADLVFNPAANALKLELTVNEPKNGMLAKAMQLPGAPAVNIKVTGDGPLSLWTGTATAALDGAEVLKLDGSHTLASDGYRTVSLKGGGTFASLIPPAFRPLFEGTTAIDLAAAFDNGKAVRIQKGTLSTGALSLSASGTMTTEGENDLKASLSGIDGPIDFRLPLGSGEAALSINSANVSLLGNAGSAVLDIGADIGKATLPQGEVNAITLHAYSDSFNLTDRSGSLTTTIQTGATRFVDANIDRLVKGPVKLDGVIGVTPQVVSFDPLTLESASIGGTVSGSYTLADGSATAALKLFALPATLPPAIAARFDTTIALSGNLALAATGGIDIRDLALTSGPLQAAGSVNYDDEGNLVAALTGTVPDLGRFLADAKGAATFKADASGPLESLVIAAQIESSGATLAGRTLNDLVVKADATTSGNRQDASITATGTLQDQPIDIRTDLSATSGQVSIPLLEATIGTNTLKGALDLDKAFQPNGAIDFNLPDLGLIAAMAGQNATGDLAGSATVKSENDVTSIALKASGTGISSGDLTISKPQADITIADLQALAIQGTLTVDTVSQGSNRLSALSLDFAQGSDRTTFTLGGTYDGKPLTLDGALRVAEGKTDIDLAALEATPANTPLKLAAPTTVSIENGTFRLQDVSISTPAGLLTVTGSAGQTLDLKARLTGIAGGDFVLPLAEGEARIGIDTADVSIVGPLNGAVLDVTADLRSLALPQGRVEGVKLVARSEAFNLAARSGAVKATVRTGNTQLTDPNLDRLVKGPVEIDATLDVTAEAIGFSPVTLRSANLDGTLNGRFLLATGSLETDVDLAARPEALPPAVSAKFDTPIAVTGKVTTGAGGAVNVTGLDVRSGTLQATGTVALADGNLTTDIAGTLPDIGKLLTDASGTAKFDANVTGPLDALRVKANVTSSGATLAGRTLSDLIVNADATIDQTSPQATITATGALDGQAIDIKADVQSKDGRTTVPRLEARIGDNRLNGSLNFTPDFVPDGTIDFTFPDVGLLAAMAGEKASGDIAGSATIRTTNGTTSVALKASGSGIKRGDLTITRPQADISIADLKTLAIRGNLSVATVAQGENRLDGLKLDFDQQAEKTNFALDGTYDGGPLSARGFITSASGRTDVNLASFSGAPRKIPVKLAKATVISIENGTVRLNDLVIQAGGGTIAVAGSAGQSLDISARLSALPATLINTFAPSLGAEGAINGTVTAKGAAANPVVGYDLRWANAALAQTRSAGVGVLDITARGQLANNTVTVETTVGGGGGLAFKGGGKVGLSGARPLDLKLNGTLPFGLASALLAEQGFTLTGQAALDVTVGGTVAAPNIDGSIVTSGARFLDVRRNLAVNDLSARVSLDGRQATIASLTGRLASGGAVSASGTVGIGAGFPADLAIKLNNATYVDGTLFTATLNGDLTIKGPLIAGPVLGGRVTIVKAAITIPEKLPASLSDINIKHKNAPADVRRMQADIRKDDGGNGTSGGGIAFDLTVTSPGKMFVRGRGIDAELGGDLTIRGNAAQPEVSGGFQMRRGRLEILGKRLDFSKGSISFGGGLIPTLDLDATSTAGSTTITVNVAGVANNPSVTFSSSPALPQDEILAQLIFNRSLSNLSALQIAQLASAVSQLAGGQGGSLFDGLRNKLGVDDLDISTDEGGGATVRAGKYLNDRTYLELQQGGDTGGAKATINLDIGRGFKLQGGAGTDGGSGGIFYEKEY